MKKWISIIICCLVLCSCGNRSSHHSIQETKEADSFYLKIEINKDFFLEKEEIQIHSSFEYVGEKEIHFDQEPSMTVIITKRGEKSMVRKFEFSATKTIMNKGDVHNEEIKDFQLKKGKYSVLVDLSIFSTGSRVYKLSTSPILFEVT